MNNTIKFTTSNQFNNTHNLKPNMNNLNNIKKKKLLLSCLFNKYTTSLNKTLNNNIYTQHNIKNWRNIILRNNNTINNINKQRIIWLRKIYDTNNLYSWTKNQRILIKQATLHICNTQERKTGLKFTTYKKEKREWNLNKQLIHNTHFKLTYHTHRKLNNTNIIHTLKYLTQNSYIKNNLNKNYGKLNTKYINNKNINITPIKNNSLKAARIIEYSKLKLNIQQQKNSQIDTSTHRKDNNKNIRKKKTGYQKNENLTIHISTHDNFKIRNTLIKEHSKNRINIQTQTKHIK